MNIRIVIFIAGLTIAFVAVGALVTVLVLNSERSSEDSLVVQHNGYPPNPSPTLLELPEEYKDTHEQEFGYISTNPQTVDLIDGLLETEPSESFTKVLENAHRDVFATYPCDYGEENGDVLLLTAKYTQDPAGNNFRAATVAVNQWEKDMVKDIGSIIYSQSVDYENAVVSDFSTLPDTQIRWAQVYADRETLYVYYTWVLNYVLISSSLNCLEAAADSLYHPGTH